MTPTGEFSHKVTVNPWPEDNIMVELTATPAEREALKQRFDLVGLPSLSASVGIEKKMTDLVLAGTIEAVVEQTCVVTLKPVMSSLEVPFERRYRRHETHAKLMSAGGDEMRDEEMIDIDVIEGDDIDVGEAVAEEFYLALDPYPRVPDADQTLKEFGAEAGVGIGDQTDNPFEKLRRH